MAFKELGYEDERFEITVDENFHCLICFNVLKDPVMCERNQHCFCRDCIMMHFDTNSSTCPTCAEKLNVNRLCKVPRFVTNYLNNLKIHCDYHDRGCRELVQLQKLEQHVAECGFSPLVCQNQGCNEEVNRRDRIYHETELCTFRKVKCHNCGEISTTVTGMAATIAKLETKISNIEKDFAVKTKDSITNLEDVNTKIGNVGTEIANIAARMTNMDAKLGSMETNMGSYQVNVGPKLEELNKEVKTVKSTLIEVKNGFEYLKEIVLINEIKQGQLEAPTDGTGTAAYEKRENQHILVTGGVEKNSVEIFNCRKKLWTLLKPMPEKRCNASLFVYNNQVTMAGGSCPEVVDSMIQMNIHLIPDLSTTWNNFAAKLPAKMHSHSSVVHDDSLFVIGGKHAEQSSYSNCIHQIQLKPPHAVQLVSKMPEPRARHSTALFNDKILILGGCSYTTKPGKTKANLSSVLCYDTKKNKCTPLSPLPYPVCQMATVKWDDENLVIAGGIDIGGEVLNRVIIYNLQTGESRVLPCMLQARRGCVAVVVGKTIVVLGGMDESSNHLKSVEGFSFVRSKWENLPDMENARHLAAAVVI